MSNDPTYTGDFAYPLALNTYKMEVDPSSLFSMLFLETTTFETLGIPDDKLVNLNYTFFGEGPLIER